MNETNYWKQFFCTGKVEDYLKYKESRNELISGQTDNSKVKEEYAGFYQSNRDCHKD